VPDKIITDQGKNFEANLMKVLCQNLKIEKLRSSPYHPMANGEVERQNKTLKSMLACYVNNNHTDWDQYLQPVAFAYNTTVHSTTGVAPYKILFGTCEKNVGDIHFSNKNVNSPINQADYLDKLEFNRKQALDNAKKQSDLRKSDQKRYYDDHAREKSTIKVGDLVKLQNTRRQSGLLSETSMNIGQLIQLSLYKKAKETILINNLNLNANEIIENPNKNVQNHVESTTDTNNDESNEFRDAEGEQEARVAAADAITNNTLNENNAETEQEARQTVTDVTTNNSPNTTPTNQLRRSSRERQPIQHLNVSQHKKKIIKSYYIAVHTNICTHLIQFTI
jgi:hypothetical protein